MSITYRVCSLCWATVSAMCVPCCPAVMLYCTDQFICLVFVHQ